MNDKPVIRRKTILMILIVFFVLGAGLISSYFLIFKHKISADLNSDLITNLVVKNGSPEYNNPSTFAIGNKVFGDRTFTVSSAPSYMLVPEAESIVTANDDKIDQDIQITFNLTKESDVYLMRDSRYRTNNVALPSWMDATWSIQTDKVTRTNTNGSFSDHDIYKKRFASGAVTFGSNAATGDYSMYFVVAIPLGTTSQSGLISKIGVSNSSLAAQYSIGGSMKEGDKVYGDKTYTYKTVPTYLKVPQANRILTANADKSDSDISLSMTLSADADVYILRDARYSTTNVPDWLKSYSKVGTDKVVRTDINNRVSQYYIYKKTYQAGTVDSGINAPSTERKDYAMYTIVVTPKAVAETPEVLVGAGDIAYSGYDMEKTASLIDSIPGTVFTAGDNNQSNTTDYAAKLTEYNSYFTPSWGRFLNRLRPAMGNHDYLSPKAYFDFFGSIAGPTDKGYYSYDLGSWHIIVLNGNKEYAAGSVQENWLKTDLASNTKTCTLAIWHQPRFSSSNHGSNTNYATFWNDLYNAKAEVVINGHDHVYERFAPQTPSATADASNGIREFVSGTGGAPNYGFKTTLAANSEVRLSNHGVLKLSLYSNRYEWQFIHIDDSAVLDSGSTNCH